MARSASKRRHSPNFSASNLPPVVNFSPISREGIYGLISLVTRELKRFPAGNEHDIDLLDSSYRRSERNGMPIARKHRPGHRFVPMADLSNLCRAARRLCAGPEVIRDK